MQFFILVSIFLFLSSLLLFRKWRSSNSQTKRLPPGPWKLPLFGSMFHMLGGLPHHVLRNLAKKYGPIMHLQLGEMPIVVVTSREMAKEVLKTHDLAFASRPKLVAVEIGCYNGTDIAFSPYGDYWRQMRKICVLELLSAKNVRSFSSIRRDEVCHLIEFIRSSPGEPVNVTKRIYLLTSSIILRSAFGKVIKEQDECIRLIKDVSGLVGGFDVADIFPSLKFLHVLSGKKGKMMYLHHKIDAIVENVINEHKQNLATGKINGELGDLFAGGTETSSSIITWAMVEMMKNPSVLIKAQAEVKDAFKGKETFDETDAEELKYLKLVIKETFRLHPSLPLLIPRECREETNINDYTIPLKTTIMVNVCAMGRDPKYWVDAESFQPERFEHSTMNFVGNNFEYLPFGSGRRICPGILFGLANIYLPLAQLLYHFDWSLPAGINPSDLDLTESAGLAVLRKSDLYLIATPYPTSSE
ncbi:premnaspirodiene oxygenase-like [Nicotiana sylvestris]|uniref:premnaspirodiene oxygenase-like n=1 Tax=Nicotiana sylvestris TaxID=4096 RepID=UPI00388C4FE3